MISDCKVLTVEIGIYTFLAGPWTNQRADNHVARTQRRPLAAARAQATTTLRKMSV